MMRRLSGGSDRGQSAPEYIGLILLIAAIVVALVALLIPSRVAQSMRTSICRVFGGECSAISPPPKPRNVQYRPDVCRTAIKRRTVGFNAEAFILSAGHEYGLLQWRMSNGKYKITVINASSSGVSTGIGADLELGPFKAAGVVEAGAEFELDRGDTWVFDSKEGVEQFRRQLGKRALVKSIPYVGDAVDIYEDLSKDKVFVTEPEITRTQMSFREYANLFVGFGVQLPKGSVGEKSAGTDSGVSPFAGVQGSGSAESSVSVFHNRDQGTRTFVIQFSVEGSGAANFGVGPSWNGSRTGTIKITRKNGRMIGLKLIQTSVVNGEATITTSRLEVDNARERRAFRQWLWRTPGAQLRLTWNDMVQENRPGASATPLERLLYREARVSKVTYDVDRTAVEAGAEIALALKLGLSANVLFTNKEATSAQFLGAPVNGERRYVPYEECVK